MDRYNLEGRSHGSPIHLPGENEKDQKPLANLANKISKNLKSGTAGYKPRVVSPHQPNIFKIS
jgi:hypothetical protein